MNSWKPFAALVLGALLVSSCQHDVLRVSSYEELSDAKLLEYYDAVNYEIEASKTEVEETAGSPRVVSKAMRTSRLKELRKRRASVRSELRQRGIVLERTEDEE